MSSIVVVKSNKCLVPTSYGVRTNEMYNLHLLIDISDKSSESRKRSVVDAKSNQTQSLAHTPKLLYAH